MTTQIPWYQEYFRGKRITLMGLGLLGRGIQDALFLLECGAILTITDRKSEKELAPAVAKFAKYQDNITWVLGRHRKKDFQSCDMVIHASSVPLGNEYLDVARKKKIPVHMSAGLLVYMVREHFDDMVIIGVTGSKGKSTVTEMIRTILAHSSFRYHLGGNIRGVATLPLLAKIKHKDVLLLELDSWQLQGFGYIKQSPDISVFTNFFPDHMDYYGGSMKKYFRDKANIFRYQKTPQCFVSSTVKQAAREYGVSSDTERMRTITSGRLPEWKYRVVGDHMLQNIALAYQVGISLELEEKVIKQALESFEPIEGRMQYMGLFDGVHFYNDNNSTTPESTLLSLRSIKKKHQKNNLVWIAGGAHKDTDYTILGNMAPRLVSHAVLFRGEGTNDIVQYFPKSFNDYVRADSMEAVFSHLARSVNKGEVVVLSPAASSFGMFINEYDRNDQFVLGVKKFKRT